MHADTAKLPAWVGLDVGGEGYAIARINKVLPRNPAPAGATEQERGQVVRWLAGAESDAYYEVLKARFKVQIKVPRPSDNSTAVGATE